MIRILAILLTLTMPLMAAENVLSRSAARLRDDKALTIAYFGGSLTSGSGASDVEKTSWRAYTTKWFRVTFPEARITEINAAIGGTGSDLGVYRLGMDVLDRKPDLVFVEFAVNDDGRAQGDKNSVIPAMEGIVRQIWRWNPLADIVFVLTTMQKWEPYLIKGDTPPSVEIHRRIADHYGIPVIDVGTALWETVKSKQHSWEELMPDKVHPTDTGYSIYTRSILAFLEAQDWGKSSTTPVNLPVRIDPKSLENAYFVSFRNAAAPGWEMQQRKIGHQTECIASNKPGDELSFRFNGNAIGVFWLSADESGDVEWSVDGAPFQRASSWSPYGGPNGRGYSRMLCEPGSVQDGEHELKLRVSAERHAKSTGNWIRIAAFLVNSP